MTERERIGFFNLYFEQNLYTSKSKSIIGKYFVSLKDVDWTNISKVKNLPEEFIGIFADDFSVSDWKNICKNSTLSEKFIKEFKYYIHLPYIIQYQNISDELKREIESILQRKESIAKNYSLPNVFIEKYNSEDRVVWNEIED
jgi:hypothetical protein